MKNFVRLHNSNDNSVVIVNVNDIVCIDSKNNGGRNLAEIYLKNCSDMDSFTTNESPEKIYEMLEKM